MSFSKKMAAFFGFGHEPELEDDDVPTAVSAHAAKSSPVPELSEVSDVELDGEQTRLIFDHVVAIFNDALPAFLAKSVDPEKQKSALYSALDQGVKDYLASVKDAAQARCQAQWAAEREKLTAEADALKKRAGELEEKNTLTQEKRMSADRQKRALSERVRDLEMQVQKLEAEKEQYEIESKCMVNKTKAAAVLEKELEDLRGENNELRASLLKGVDPQSIAANDAELQSLKSELEAAKAEAEAAKAEAEAAKADVDATKSEAEAAKAEAQSAKADLETAKGKADELKHALDDAVAELELTKESMPEDPGITREELEEIEQKLAGFEEIKQKLDARIEGLKDNLRTAQRQIKQLQKANVEALRAHAAEVKQLREELDAATRPDTPIEDVPRSELADELMSDTDWLVASPPNTPSMRPPEDPEFGYQPPQRKAHQRVNDAQMSLFD